MSQQWQPPQYDPYAHQRNIRGQQEPPWEQPSFPGPQYPYRQDLPPVFPPPEQGYGQQPPRPHRRQRPRVPLWGGLAAIVILAGGGTVYALAGHGSTLAASKPLTCKQQYANWKTGPAHAQGEQLKADAATVSSAGNSEDVPVMTSALKAIGADATALEQYPMPACADPAGYWKQTLADMKAAGDNAGAASGLGGILLAEAPLKKVTPLEGKLTAELKRTAGA